MRKKVENVPRGPDPGGLTRREVIAGAAAVALAAGMPVAARASARRKNPDTSRPVATTTPVRRYMAAAAVLGDGRVLVTGGYDQPWSKDSTPQPLSSVMIFDPANGQWSPGAPMMLPRARHAAVTLSDGRVAVLGGISMNPTSTVEIYDPRSNKWSTATSLAQPRYDHAAATVGHDIYVMGGSSQTMLATVEVVRPVVTKFTP